MMSTKILVIVAHPDDEVLGCGGIIAKHSAAGDEVYVLFLGKGRDDKYDQKFDTIPLLHFIQKIEQTIKRIEPWIIYTHCSSDINRDHRIIHEAVLVATRPPSPVKELYAFDVTSDWAFGSFGSFQPNVFVEIDIDKKIGAMQAYKDELKSYPHPRSLEMIKVVAQKWGSVIGVEYAEAFELVRWIK